MGSLAIRSLQQSDGIPVLETARLVLRPYAEADIPALIRLAGVREVAATTLRIPHPYTEQNAREYLAICQAESNSGPVTRFAITLRNTGEFCGGAGLRLDPAHVHGELGYWLGVPFWGQGYATEAARAVIDYGFGDLGLHRIYASHFAGNDASGRILRKLGMHHEGCMRGHIRKWDSFHDLECYGMLGTDRSSQH
jgi:ribosomal-protein-alanine N-acetyltransferase